MSQFLELLRATKVFILVRLVVAIFLTVFYLLVAAAIQYYYVQIFGESTFNYITGGILSLMAGSLVCTVIGRFILMFVRGWNVGATVYSKQIIERNLPPLEVGMAVFKKNIGSFTVVYSVATLLKKFTAGAVDKLWDLFEDVPFISSLKKVTEWPVVRRLAEDLLDTAFDCLVYYIAKYTKSGISESFSAIPKALRKYLQVLPQIIGASLGWFALSWVIPKVLRIILTLYVFRTGIVGGLLLNVLLYPVFFSISCVIIEPVRTAFFLSAFAEVCAEEPVEDCPYQTIIDGILDALGLDEMFKSAEEDVETAVEDAAVSAEECDDTGDEDEDEAKESVTVEFPHNQEVSIADKISAALANDDTPIPAVERSKSIIAKKTNEFVLPISNDPDDGADEDEGGVVNLSSLLSTFNVDSAALFDAMNECDDLDSQL